MINENDVCKDYTSIRIMLYGSNFILLEVNAKVFVTTLFLLLVALLHVQNHTFSTGFRSRIA